MSLVLILSLVLFSSLGQAEQCGPLAGNKTCLQTTGKALCCSVNGWCGNEDAYCSPYTCASECKVKPTYCGNDLCDGTETCSSCPKDCGACPKSDVVYTGCHPSVGPLKFAMTFDDGPTVGYVTERLLDILKEEGVKATFFVVGNRMEAPAGIPIAKRARAEGHLLLSHTYSHPDLATLTVQQIRDEMTRSERAFRNAMCTRVPRVVRPPYGSLNTQAIQTIHNMGFRLVNWNLDTRDWDFIAKGQPASDIVSNIKMLLDQMKPQSVVPLQHDLYNESVSTVREVIQYAKSLGYSFITMDECLLGPPSARIDPDELAPWTWATETNSAGCLDKNFNPMGGGNCTQDSDCNFGSCVNFQCTCSSGWTCPYCNFNLAVMQSYHVCEVSAMIDPENLKAMKTQASSASPISQLSILLALVVALIHTTGILA